MILVFVLIAGCALWALGETGMLVSGGMAAAAGWTMTLGLYVAGAGMFALKDLPGMARTGRVGIVLSAFGAFSFATVMTIVLTSGVLGAMETGAVRHAEMVFTPFYLLALAFVVGGLVALALHFRGARGAGFSRAAASGAGVLALASFARLILADVPLYHEAVSALVALYFAALGVAVLRRGD